MAWPKITGRKMETRCILLEEIPRSYKSLFIGMPFFFHFICYNNYNYILYLECQRRTEKSLFVSLYLSDFDYEQPDTLPTIVF
jgi:hypothetical protein